MGSQKTESKPLTNIQYNYKTWSANSNTHPPPFSHLPLTPTTHHNTGTTRVVRAADGVARSTGAGEEHGHHAEHREDDDLQQVGHDG